MAPGIGGGSRADIAPLDIPDDDQAFFPAVADGLIVGHQSGNAELLIHGDLGLDGRDQVADRVHDPFVELPDRFRGRIQSFAAKAGNSVVPGGFFQQKARYKCKIRVQTDHHGGVFGLDLFDQFLNHRQYSLSVRGGRSVRGRYFESPQV